MRERTCCADENKLIEKESITSIKMCFNVLLNNIKNKQCVNTKYKNIIKSHDKSTCRIS